MGKKSIDLFEYIQGHTVRLETSHRGGGIEIDATEYLGYGGRYPLRMTAYQNYLGGGMLGAVQSSIQGHLRDYPKATQTKALALAEALKRYYYNITNEIVEDYDEWAASASYEAQQARPVSAY